MHWFMPRRVAARARERKPGPYVECERATPEPVLLFLQVTSPFWLLLPLVLLVRLCMGHWDERTVTGGLCTLAGLLAIAFGFRIGWYRGALYRFRRGVVLRKFWTYRAYTWAELTTETHGYWTDEGDRFEYRVWREELELRTPYGSRVYRYERNPSGVEELVRAAHDPQDAVPAGYEGGSEDVRP